jgi:Na+-driven multidrug efflux pump
VTHSFDVTSRQVFAIAGPVMLANITTPLLGVVATAAMGRLGDAAILGGVAMASLVFDCIFWLFGFLRMGTVALTAQALGAGDHNEERAVLWRALLTAAAIGIALFAVQAPLAGLIFSALGGSAAVTAAARLYFFIRLWSAPFALGNYVILGWLVGLAHPRLALAVQILINAVNMALTVLLVLGLNWGVSGAATAAVVRRRHHVDLRGHWPPAYQPDDGKPRRARNGLRLSLARCVGAGLRRHGVQFRRHLYRRHLGARHAQPHGRFLPRLSRSLVARPPARQ